jgi:hypothetical protein
MRSFTGRMGGTNLSKYASLVEDTPVASRHGSLVPRP